MAKTQPAPNSREENVPLLRKDDASSPGDAGAAIEGGTPSGDVKPLSLETSPHSTPSEVAEQPKYTYDEYSRTPVFPEPLIGLQLWEPSEMPRLGHVLLGYEVARKVSPAGYVTVVLLIIASLSWPEPETRPFFFVLAFLAPMWSKVHKSYQRPVYGPPGTTPRWYIRCLLVFYIRVSAKKLAIQMIARNESQIACAGSLFS
ncbi:hypothetical protein D9Q98_008126 [Chlorella vulgaris]|uniref:Uncharacterized protein n=1 Tax=Chlorella vulgaris TaxID=3077 RepID=A0A9D4TG13_CHLVU|nr:hypothetical protein D9Q98_008126 [Chlorella vulgaris]